MHPAILKSQQSLDPALKIPRIAILGCGSIGGRHLANLHSLGARDLVVFDPDAKAVEEEAAKYPGLVTCTKVEDVWATSPWAVLVTCPSQLHLEFARRALELKSHVFVEKPLSSSLEGLDELAAQAEAQKVTTMVACNMRFHPGPALVQSLLQEKAIGELLSYRVVTGSYLPQWRPQQDYRKSYSASVEYGGAILDCIHELDLALWYAGSARLLAAKSIRAEAIGLQTDGLAEILLDHASGTLGSVHLNFIERDYRRTCVCLGTEGTLEWNYAEKVVLQHGKNSGEITRHPLDENWQTNTMYLDEIRYFLHCALENKPTFICIQDNLSCLKLALEARSR